MRGQQCGLIHGFYYSLRWLLWTILVRVILQVSLLSLNNYKSENNRTAEWVSPYDRFFFLEPLFLTFIGITCLHHATIDIQIRIFISYVLKLQLRTMFLHIIQ